MTAEQFGYLAGYGFTCLGGVLSLVALLIASFDVVTTLRIPDNPEDVARGKYKMMRAVLMLAVFWTFTSILAILFAAVRFGPRPIGS